MTFKTRLTVFLTCVAVAMVAALGTDARQEGQGVPLARQLAYLKGQRTYL
jgi:hypothetical protein